MSLTEKEILEKENQNVLVLEDDSIRQEWFRKYCLGNVTICENVDDCINALQTKTKWSKIYLDHDLGKEETGVVIAEYIAYWGIIGDPVVIIHSMNPIGAMGMKDILVDEDSNFNGHVLVINFGSLIASCCDPF